MSGKAMVFSSVVGLPQSFKLSSLPRVPLPTGVLMCPPDYFDVIDVKNAFMDGQIGKVDRTRARDQWNRLKAAFESIGLNVEIIPALEGREDMVFCANQTFVGLNEKQERVCVLSQMRFPSRQEEVPAFADWFAKRGYHVLPLGNPSLTFEGGGDAIWHPGRALIWGGVGERTNKEAHGYLARIFGVPLLTLDLTPPFYHLDTCFCPINEEIALVYRPAFSEEGLSLIGHLFPQVIPVDQHEAVKLMACNAAAFHNRDVVIQCGSETVIKELRGSGFNVIEVDTSEFLKSGGSVYCLKMALY